MKKTTTYVLVFVEHDGDDLLVGRQFRHYPHSIEITFTRSLSNSLAQLDSRQWDLVIVIADRIDAAKTLPRSANLPALLFISRHPVTDLPDNSLFLLRREVAELSHVTDILTGKKSSDSKQFPGISSKTTSLDWKYDFSIPVVLFRFSADLSNRSLRQLILSNFAGSSERLLGYSEALLCQKPSLFLHHLTANDRRSTMRRLCGLLRHFDYRCWSTPYKKDGQWRQLWLYVVSRPCSSSGLRLDGAILDAETLSSVSQCEEHSKAASPLLIEIAREEEREKIARDLHDELGNRLLGAKLDLSRVMRSDLPETALHLLERVETVIKATMSTTRRIARELRPDLLRNFGLIEALRQLLGDFQEKSGLTIDFSTNCITLSLDEKSTLTLFRVTQEALTNVIKHAAATKIAITLTKETSCIRLEIADNGIGISVFDMNKPKSIGIRTMKERVTLCGGIFTIGKVEPGGACIVAHLPLS